MKVIPMSMQEIDDDDTAVVELNDDEANAGLPEGFIRDCYDDAIPVGFDDELTTMLPEEIAHVVGLHESKAERDVALFSIFNTLSAAMPHVEFTHRSIYRANTMSLIIGPSGSGKGVMEFAYKLVAPIEQELREINVAAQKEYESKMIDYECDLRNYKDSRKHGYLGADGIPLEQPVMPERPPYRQFTLSASTTYPGFLKVVHDNPDTLLIFDTEAATMEMSRKGDYGINGSVIMKLFGHEKLDRDIKTEERNEVLHPYVSVQMSGTFRYLSEHFTNTSDGEFNRYDFFLVPEDRTYRMFDEESTRRINEAYDDLSLIVYQIYKSLSSSDTELQYVISKETRKVICDFCENLDQYYSLADPTCTQDMFAVIKRRNVGIYRRAMLADIFRYLVDHKYQLPEDGIIPCTQQAIEMAMSMTETLVRHSYAAMQYIHADRTNEVKHNLHLVPGLQMIRDIDKDTFTTAEAFAIGSMHRLSKRQIERMLTEMVRNGWLIKEKKGVYRKQDLDQVSSVKRKKLQ